MNARVADTADDAAAATRAHGRHLGGRQLGGLTSASMLTAMPGCDGQLACGACGSRPRSALRGGGGEGAVKATLLQRGGSSTRGRGRLSSRCRRPTPEALVLLPTLTHTLCHTPLACTHAWCQLTHFRRRSPGPGSESRRPRCRGRRHVRPGGAGGCSRAPLLAACWSWISSFAAAAAR